MTMLTTDADTVLTLLTIDASGGQFAPWHSGVSAMHQSVLVISEQMFV